MNRLLTLIVALLWCFAPAVAMSPSQVATVTPAYQAPGWTGFTPTSLGATVVAYWDADDHGTARMTDAGAGVISAWQDKTAGLSLTAATTARPTWTATAFNNGRFAGITCDGVANNLRAAATTGLVTGTTDGWVFALEQAVSSATTYAIVGYGDSANANGTRQLSKQTNDTQQTGNATVNLNDSGRTVAGPHVIAGNWNSTTISAFLDDAPVSRVSAAASSNTSTTRTTFCGSQAASPANFYSGVLRYVIVTSALTVTQRQQLSAWLAYNGGVEANLPWNHPYRFRKP